jgi:hypothetical protein
MGRRSPSISTPVTRSSSRRHTRGTPVRGCPALPHRCRISLQCPPRRHARRSRSCRLRACTSTSSIRTPATSPEATAMLTLASTVAVDPDTRAVVASGTTVMATPGTMVVATTPATTPDTMIPATTRALKGKCSLNNNSEFHDAMGNSNAVISNSTICQWIRNSAIYHC